MVGNGFSVWFFIVSPVTSSSITKSVSEPGYESIWDSGEGMRRKIRHWLIHSSLLSWRVSESELANLWTFLCMP
jgi:hypothetical protein